MLIGMTQQLLARRKQARQHMPNSSSSSGQAHMQQLQSQHSTPESCGSIQQQLSTQYLQVLMHLWLLMLLLLPQLMQQQQLLQLWTSPWLLQAAWTPAQPAQLQGRPAQDFPPILSDRASAQHRQATAQQLQTHLAPILVVS
jgi:hypothetical protein